MISVFFRGIEGVLGPLYTPRCAIGCHTVGEPGLDDGGFEHVSRECAYAIPAHGAAGQWNAMPRALRRLGGVGCTACHGPGALPERSDRWPILRADICAVCHDAPPRYGYVVAWRRSRMSRADAVPEVRGNARCETCHTTRGFLASLGIAGLPSGPPPSAGPLGVACAACHAPHNENIGRALLRKFDPPKVLANNLQSLEANSPSRVCLRCHAPLDDTTTPDATSAALWLGRAGVDPRTGNAIIGPAVHQAVRDGCVGCHAAGDEGAPVLSRGGNHTFHSDRSRCAGCHAGGGMPAERIGEDGQRIAARAAALWSRVQLLAGGIPGTAVPTRPVHATAQGLGALSTETARAAYDVLLVLEDPAAAVHNAAYARMLLDAAETVLPRPTAPSAPSP